MILKTEKWQTPSQIKSQKNRNQKRTEMKSLATGSVSQGNKGKRCETVTLNRNIVIGF